MTSRTGNEPAHRLARIVRALHGSDDSKNRETREPAFTLIEVLVTVAILAVGIALVLQAFGTSMSALAVSNDTLRAGRLLREKMNDIERAVREDAQLPDGPRDGLLDVNTGGAFRWKIRSAPVTVLNREIQEVTVTVWRDGQQRRASLATRFATGRGGN